jgi:hypothetical protein
VTKSAILTTFETDLRKLRGITHVDFDLNPSRHTMLCVVRHNQARGMVNSRLALALALASEDEDDWLDLNNRVE